MSNGEGQTTLEEKLYKLRCNYFASLPVEFSLLTELSANIRPDNVEELFNRLHRLAGTAGSLGQQALSKHALPLAAKLRRWKENPVYITNIQESKDFAADVAALNQCVVAVIAP